MMDFYSYRIVVWIVLFGLLCPDCRSSPAVSCPLQSVICNSTLICVDARYLCDGDNDCDDGEDELNCETRDSGCGGVSRRSETTGSITSMNYPANYSNMANCRWYIQVPGSSVIVFKFSDLYDIEKQHHGRCVYDAVSIYQDEPLHLIREYCGSMIPQPVTVNGSKAVVEFRSDARINGAGFNLSWTAQKLDQIQDPVNESLTTKMQPATSTSQPVCADVVELTSGIGHISSPFFLDQLPYSSPLLCRWRIKVLPQYFISLTFDFLDVGVVYSDGCTNGWVKMFDGQDESSTLIGQFCGNTLPGEVRSISNEVLVVMEVSNNLRDQLGFMLSYSAFRSVTTTTTSQPLPDGCDGSPIVLTSLSGYITSPSFDNSKLISYRENLDCRWILIGEPGNVFYFTFNDFEIEQSSTCEFDSLRVYDPLLGNKSDSDAAGGLTQNIYTNNTDKNADIDATSQHVNVSGGFLVEKAKLCGLMLPYNIESSSNRVVLQFTTDDQDGGYGFNVTFVQRPPSVKCQPGEFQCGSMGCINDSLICDGVSDCPDGSDEMICTGNSTDCGHPSVQPVFSRIVGGSEAVPGSWPWMVSIVSSDPVPDSHQCGASLILPQWALTAAHCFENIYSRKYDDFSLIVGRQQIGHPDKNEQKRQFEKVFMHRDYNKLSSQNDIALIKVREAFNMTTHTGLACLPKETVAAGQLCYVTGWGETLSTCCAGRLKQAPVPVMDFGLCGQQDYLGDQVMEHMLCAGYTEGGIDSCDGDSGGPLNCKSENGKWEVQGVTSWGFLCAMPKRPGVYTVVHDYLRWIQQTVALNTP